MQIKYPAVFTPVGNMIVAEAPGLGLFIKSQDMEAAIGMVKKAIEHKIDSNGFGENRIPKVCPKEKINTNKLLYYCEGKSVIKNVEVDVNIA